MRNFIVVILMFVAANLAIGQNCKVLLESIQGSYEGDCKKGLAHGLGFSEGIDTYDGKFKKGLPNGKGVYTWSNGSVYTGEWRKGKRNGFGILTSKKDGQEIVKKGYWDNNNYIGVYKKGEEAKTLNKTSVGSISYKQQGEGEAIHIKVNRMGNNMMGKIRDLRLSPSSGFESVESNKIIYDSVTFPFTLKINFKGPNKLETIMVSYEAEFIINKPGKWEVKLDI